MPNDEDVLNLYRAIPRSQTIIVDQYPGDDPGTEPNEAKQAARGEHDDVRFERARVNLTLAEVFWRLNADWGRPQWVRSLAVAAQADASMTVSWNPGAGISQWTRWSVEHVLSVDWHLDRLQLMRELSGQEPIGWHIINHEHGVVGTSSEVANPEHRATADAEVVTTFLRAIVGAMHAEFPQSTAMVYNEGHYYADAEALIFEHFDQVPEPIPSIGDVDCCSAYPGSLDRFIEIAEGAGVADTSNPLYPWLWMSQFNVWAGGNKWWHGRERYDWHEDHLVEYMALVGRHIRETDSIGGCVIHRPLILDLMQVRGLAALVGGINAI